MSACRSVCLSACLPVCLPACLPVCLSEEKPNHVSSCQGRGSSSHLLRCSPGLTRARRRIRLVVWGVTSQPLADTAGPMVNGSRAFALAGLLATLGCLMPSASDPPAMAPSFAVRLATPKDAAQVDAVLGASYPKLMREADQIRTEK